jgi:hypothetical protein
VHVVYTYNIFKVIQEKKLLRTEHQLLTQGQYKHEHEEPKTRD